MIYTLKLDVNALQVIGEALAIAPMAMRATSPVLTAIQQQVSEQEAAAPASAAHTHTITPPTAPEASEEEASDDAGPRALPDEALRP